MDKKIEVFGKSMDTPQSIAGLSGLDPAPMGGIPSGVFAIFAVVILTVSLATYMPEDTIPQIVLAHPLCFLLMIHVDFLKWT